MLRNIFQLKKSDWQRLVDAVNAYAGNYIIISRTPRGLEISIDEQQIRRYVRSNVLQYRVSN